MKLLVPDVNGADCCCVLQKFVMVWDIPPSNMLEVRHRIYTEAEKRFLDYIDIQLKDQKISNFSLKCIDYGDAKHKFDFPICHTDSLRESLWKDLDVLQVENPESLELADGVPHRKTEIKRKRGGEVKTPFLGFTELESDKLSHEQLATKANREKNFAYAPDDFKQWYLSIMAFNATVTQNSNSWGWEVQEEYIYPNSVAIVAPSKLMVTKESLRKDISKLKKEAVKATETIEKLHVRLKENSSKKSKVHEGDAKNIEVLAEEKANEMFQTWQTDDEDRYKEQIRVLKESRATEMDKNKKLEKELAEEKTTCADLRKDIDTNDRLHKLEVKNLEQRLEATQKDKEYLQTAFYPRNSSTAQAFTSRHASMNHVSPDVQLGQKRLNPPGSGDSP